MRKEKRGNKERKRVKWGHKCKRDKEELTLNSQTKQINNNQKYKEISCYAHTKKTV